MRTIFFLIQRSILRLILLNIVLFISCFCRITSHSSQSQKQTNLLGLESINAKNPIVTFSAIKAADWAVPLEGLIDLEDPKAKATGLEDKEEPISIYFYLVQHPKEGTFLIDSGISEEFLPGRKPPVSSIVASQMNFEKLKIHQTTKNFLDQNKIIPKGVFFTHLHLDHIMGAKEIPDSTPFYTGTGETKDRTFINAFVQGSSNRLLGGKPNLIELEIGENTNQPSILDFFGDGSFYVIHVPGHTKGSLAFFIPGKTESHLVLGDTCHTQWGWLNQVPPGSFTQDSEKNRDSLFFLKKLANSIKGIRVYPGHQASLKN